jgi:hypothetical protein
MSDYTVKIDISFEALLVAISSLEAREKRELKKFLDAELMDEPDVIDETSENEQLGFSSDRFRESWNQAITGQTLPISELWEGIDVD